MAHSEPATLSGARKMKIETIYTYPIKALRAVKLNSVQVTKHGFPHDRRFMLLQVTTDESSGAVAYKNVHVVDYPQSVFFFPSLDIAAGLLQITHRPPHGVTRSIEFPLRPDTTDLEVVDVSMYESATRAYKMPQCYNDWLSECYGFQVVLVYLGPHYRPVLMSSHHGEPPASSPGAQPSNGKGSKGNGESGWFSSLSSITNSATSYLLGGDGGVEHDPNISSSSSSSPSTTAEITFADCAPYLLASSRSMDDLHHRLQPSSSDEQDESPPRPPQQMDISKFRPNLVIAGAEAPWEEDFWGEVTIAGRTKMDCVHNCNRCQSINIDYATGKPGTGASGQMLKRMQRDRRVDAGAKYSPIFGRYSFLQRACEGDEIRVGDEVVVSRKLEERTRFDWPGICTT